jgi:DNA polymerase III gamma/tau subunit
MMDVLTDCESRLRDTGSRKILLEVTLLKMIEARHAVSIDTVLRQLQQLRAESGGALPRPTAAAAATAASRSPATATATASVPSVPSVASAAQPIPAPAPTNDLGQLWAQLSEAVNRANPMLHSSLVTARPISLTNNLLTIGFDPEFADQRSLVDNPKNQNLLQTKLAELGHPNTKVRFIEAADTAPMVPAAPSAARPGGRADDPAAPSTPAPKPALVAAPQRPNPEPAAPGKDDFKSDPLIQKALEIFKGQIVEPRS